MPAIQKYLSNLFVNLVLEAGLCRVLGRVIKGDKVVKSFEVVFENPNNDSLDEKIIKYIQAKAVDVHSVYISFFLNTLNQGAIKGVSVSDFQDHELDVKNLSYVRVKKSFSIYTSFMDIRWAKNLVKPLHLDLLYSPFALMHECVKKEEARKKQILHIYNHETSFAVAVYKNHELLFGSFFELAPSKSEINEIVEANQWTTMEEENLDSLVALDDMDLGDEEGENFSSLDDLDNIEDDEDVRSQLEQSMDEVQSLQKPLEGQGSISLVGRDLNMYKYLKSAIAEFYANPLYDGQFIEDIVIYDDHELTDTLLDMLKNELLMKVRVKKIKTLDLMCNLAKRDVFS